MPNIFSDLYTKSENLKGKKLYFILVIVVAVSLGLGIFIQNLTNQILNNNEEIELPVHNETPVKTGVEYQGVISYVDPHRYPLDNISYVLRDADENDIILLKASDEKLKVAEGLNVIVFGQLSKTKDQQSEVLMVEKLFFKNKN